jgi:eukaryotic-like serine/threonine-protein kinase
MTTVPNMRTPSAGTPSAGTPSAGMPSIVLGPNQLTTGIPSHLAGWQLPPGWRWGRGGVASEYRHSQEVVDALGRSLALVTAPNPDHAAWLETEARQLAHRNHPSVPTTYHYWTVQRDTRRGPGYLRRWIEGETLAARATRVGAADVAYVIQILRAAGSVLAYLHDAGATHGAVSPHTVWVSPTGRLWLLGWQWAVPRDAVPGGLSPDRRWMPIPPEWSDGRWSPDARSDQWQLAAVCFALLTGELPPARDVPPLRWVRPDTPQALAGVLDRALQAAPEARHRSVAALLRALDRVSVSRPLLLEGEASVPPDVPEQRLRWALADDYEVLAPLGRGTFGSVWRVRDLALQREVALKMLHASVSQDAVAVGRFRREAQLAAQLAHPAIVPIYDWDQRGDVSWYTMELAEGGSVSNLIDRGGPRPLVDVAPQVELVLDGLVAAHAIGVVHRDLKPENILIDRYRRWRISDFGIAHMPGEDAGGTTGTPAFAAPEQLLGEAQGAAVDCFALAAIVAFVLAGRPPFGEGDARTILAQQLAGAMDLSAFDPEIAAWLTRGLAADPAARFADAAAMKRAWRIAVAAAQRSARRASWWRRLVFGGSDANVPARH